jgi:hypothetical protein
LLKRKLFACISKTLNSFSEGSAGIGGRAGYGRWLGSLRIAAFIVQRTTLLGYQTSVFLYFSNGIMLDAFLARTLHSLVPEIRSSAGI